MSIPVPGLGATGRADCCGKGPLGADILGTEGAGGACDLWGTVCGLGGAAAVLGLAGAFEVWGGTTDGLAGTAAEPGLLTPAKAKDCSISGFAKKKLFHLSFATIYYGFGEDHRQKADFRVITKIKLCWVLSKIAWNLQLQNSMVTSNDSISQSYPLSLKFVIWTFTWKLKKY